MKRLEAERLLGGHAAGILTEPEKRMLFTAALEHQELFDALMDEEALRELLAEPETRQRLLALLARPRRLWQRPALLGLAASLFLVVTTSLVLLRHPEAPVPLQESDKQLTPAPQASLLAPVVQPVPAKRAKTSARATEPKALAEATLNRAEESRQDSGLAAGYSAAPPALKRELADAPKIAEAVSEAKSAKLDQARGALVKKERPLAPALERLEDGRYRLTVGRAAAGHLYVLKRTPAGTVLLKALTSTTGNVAVFELSLGDQDALDVYLLRQPTEEPTALPASVEIPGEWQRLFPQ